MAKQYWVGEFFVDLSRNQISHNGTSHTLPPKALLVLTYLAENRGKVVSYNELLEKVWQNSIVTPNTLQRSIFQLRKILTQNNQVSDLIKTHNKQGYSLECDVSYDNTNAPEIPLITHTDPPTPSIEPIESISHPYSIGQSIIQTLRATLNNKLYKWLAFPTAIILAMILYLLIITAHPPQFGELRYLTATDDKEYAARYTPDGKHILFQRYYDKVCINHIWAKNTTTLEEIRLTRQQGTYADHSLSPDGKTLIFIEQHHCKLNHQNNYYSLVSIDFNKALSQPQPSKTLLHCNSSQLKNPLWIDNQHIVMMQKQGTYWRLIHYSIKNGTYKTLYQVKNGYIITFAYSIKTATLALIWINTDGEQYIDTLTTTGESISSHKIKYPQGTSLQLKPMLAFDPKSGNLFMSAGGQLFSLTDHGDTTSIMVPVITNVGSPNFHPIEDQLLLITGRYDSDIATVTIPTGNTLNINDKNTSLTTISRSIDFEDSAKFQPNGAALAFVSARTGSEQLWVSDENGTRIISDLPKGTFIHNLHWSVNGKHLLLLSSAGIYQLSLDGPSIQIHFPHWISNIFYWNSDKQEMIANILINGNKTLVSINTKTQSYQVINNKQVRWAVQYQQNRLIFMDHMQRVWMQGPLEDELMITLNGQGSSKRFVVHQDTLYGINDQNQLWSFDINKDELTLLTELMPSIKYLTDTNGKSLLLTYIVAEKKEIIELKTFK